MSPWWSDVCGGVFSLGFRRPASFPPPPPPPPLPPFSVPVLPYTYVRTFESLSIRLMYSGTFTSVLYLDSSIAAAAACSMEQWVSAMQWRKMVLWATYVLHAGEVARKQYLFMTVWLRFLWRYLRSRGFFFQVRTTGGGHLRFFKKDHGRCMTSGRGWPYQPRDADFPPFSRPIESHSYLFYTSTIPDWHVWMMRREYHKSYFRSFAYSSPCGTLPTYR